MKCCLVYRSNAVFLFLFHYLPLLLLLLLLHLLVRNSLLLKSTVKFGTKTQVGLFFLIQFHKKRFSKEERNNLLYSMECTDASGERRASSHEARCLSVRVDIHLLNVYPLDNRPGERNSRNALNSQYDMTS